MSLKLVITKLIDPLFLTYELLVGNRRLIFPTMVGLVVALAVIAQSNILVESYRVKIFQDIVFDRDVNNIEADITVRITKEFWEETPGVDAPDFFTNMDRLNKCVMRSINTTGYSNYISNYWWYSRTDLQVWINGTGPRSGVVDRNIYAFISSSMEFYEQLRQILEAEGAGRLPNNSSEFLLLCGSERERFKEFENITLNSEVNITLPLNWIWNPEGVNRVNKTVRIVGIVECVNEINSLVNKYLGYTSTDFITFPSFLSETLEELSLNPLTIRLEGRIWGKIYLESSSFDAFKINTEKTKLQRFLISLENSLYPFFHEISIRSYILGRIETYEMTILGLILTFLLISSPVICIALYLVIYSFGLIRRQKQEQIGIIKTRGGSWFQVFIILIGELIITTVIAVFSGFIISIFLTEIVLRSTDYLEFLGDPIPVRFSIQMIRDLTIWGIVLSLLLNFSRIIRMSFQNITATLVPVEISEPFWKRYYIDVIIFLIGTITWIILNILLRMLYSGENIGGMYFLITLVFLLGIPAPFFIFFGTIMVIARSFPFLMRKLSHYLWNFEGRIIAFAVRNIVRHKQAANRAILLITLAIAFSILSSSLIFSLDETEYNKIYYEYGADINLQSNDFFNHTVLKILKENISDIKHVSPVFSAEFYSLNRNYLCLFLDPTTYLETAFFRSSFKLSSSLSNLMDQISDNKTILMFQGNFVNDFSKPKIGENFSIYLSNGTDNEYRLYTIGGTFNLWPMVYPWSWNLNHMYYIIGSIGMFYSLNQSSFLDDIIVHYLAKLDSHTNIESTAMEIYNLTKIQVNSPALYYIQYKESFNRHFTLSILNTDLIIGVTVSVIGVIMFAFFTYLERGKEIGVERALGMTRAQTAFSFLVEASTILMFGTIIGLLTGTYFVTMFLQVTQFGENIPPLVIAYPIPILAQIIFSILVIAGIGTITPAYMATRRDIGRILKVE